MLCSALLSRMYTVVSPVQQFTLYRNHNAVKKAECLNHVVLRERTVATSRSPRV